MLLSRIGNLGHGSVAGRGKRLAGAVAQVAVSSRRDDEIATAQDNLIGELPHAGLAMPRANSS